MVVRNCNLNGTLYDLHVEGSEISGLTAPGSDVGTDAAYDAKGNMVIVGLADSHMHLDKSMLVERAPYQDVPAPEKGRLTREQKALLSEEDVYRNARTVILSAIRNGTVALRTNVDVDPIIELRGVKALLRLREEFRDILTIQVVPFAQEGVFNYPETPELLERALGMGCDAVGGHTIIDSDGQGHIDTVLKIAQKFGVSCDFHVDESGKVEHFLLPYLAQQAIDKNMQGKVNAIHACSLAAVDESSATEAIELSVEAGLRFIIAPTAISTRQLTASKKLLEAQLPVVLGSDNVGDFFNPYGSANVLHVAAILMYAHRFYTEQERDTVVNMVSGAANDVFDQVFDSSGLREGALANITVLDGQTPREVLSNLSAPLLIVRNGRVIGQREERFELV